MKKFAVLFLAFFMSLSFSSYAVEFMVNNPSEEASLTGSQDFVVTGTADAGRNVTVHQYKVKRSMVDSKKKIEYELVDTLDVEADALNLFTVEFKLVKGENRLDFSIFKGKNPKTLKDEYDVITRTVNYSDDMEKEIKNIIRQIEPVKNCSVSVK